ncbi:MAG: SDR family oxidoreductase [Candidatus Omnitrophota bacterium]|nr:SDR family oxidoreductase [Candidatus Omnitrophota bacterium]
MKKNSIFGLKNKVAVVTGGAGHLGSSMSDCLAQAGARVVVAGRDIKKCGSAATTLMRKYKTISLGIEIDISSAESVKETMSLISRKMGGVDILVNNAYFGHRGSFKCDMMSMSEDMWNCGIDGTAGGVFRCTQAVIPYMQKRGSGSIINISSIYGIVSPYSGIYGKSELNNPPAYGAGKAAILQFTRYAACHLASKHIRVNSITPGAFPSRDIQKNKGFMSNLKNKIPLGRIGNPEDLKGALLFLASDASSYVTGSNIVVDGGWTAW